MKIEKLRNNHKKEIIIGTVLLVIIGGALTYKLTHSKYRITQSIDLGSGVINYKVPDFKIMAMYKQKDDVTSCTGDNCYNEITTMPTSGYVINESKTYCQTSSGSQVKGKIKTENGKHYISGLNKGDKCFLYFDKKTSVDNVTELIAKLESEAKTTAPNFSQAATTNEGVYSTTDGMYGGTTYYWRGAVTNNHVIFANKCWRIVRINGDKTIRLIYNGTVQSGNTCFGNGSNSGSIAVAEQAYNSNYDQSNYVGWTYSGTSQRTLSGTESNAKAQTETWYNNNIGNNTTYNSKVVDGKFCNNRNAGSGHTWAINGSLFYYEERTNIDNGTPTTSCPSGDVYTLKVGAITASEVIYAGGKYDTSNQSYYLYGGRDYWTMSPCVWRGNGTDVFFVNSNGNLINNYVHDSSRGLRPVINLKSDVTFSSGDGTISKPYTVS